MQMPAVQGSLSQSSYYIYTACDCKYFASFGKALINSIQANSDLGVHVHLFNPTEDQLEFCTGKNVSTTHETVDLDLFSLAVARWQLTALNDVEKTQLDRTVNAMQKGRDQNLLERMQKTYYACARFIRLAELFDQSVPVLSIDVDAVVRSSPVLLGGNIDFYVHKITGRRARTLAGGVMLNPTAGSRAFLTEYAKRLLEYLRNDYIYWGLDQDLLDQIVPKYNHNHLPAEYIDWNMQANSYIWTAKGTRKENLLFVNESARYKNV